MNNGHLSAQAILLAQLARSLVLSFTACCVLVSPVLHASPLLEGRNANVWIYGEEGDVLSVSYPNWVTQFNDAGTPLLELNEQEALVNNVAQSSTPITANLPVLSLSGLGFADTDSQQGLRQPRIWLNPDAQSSNETVVVSIRVNTDKLESPGLISWTDTLDGVEDQSAYRSVEPDQGIISLQVILVKNGEHELRVLLQDSELSATFDSISRRYTVASNHPDGERRDTDGDGLPDLLEAKLGLDVNQIDQIGSFGADGWSAFDRWLRLDQAAYDAGLDPLDSDGDGWSDFDEDLRGTQADETLLQGLQSNPQWQNTAKLQALVARLYDYPAASRLYEVEAVVDASLTPEQSGPQYQWLGVQAANTLGELSYNQAQLLSVAQARELDETLSVNINDIAEYRTQAAAKRALASGRLPTLRLALGQTQIVRIEQQYTQEFNQDGELPENWPRYRKAYKAWLAPQADLTPKAFYQAQGAGDWTSLEEWRSAYIAYLKANLVSKPALVIDQNSTLQLVLLEALIHRYLRREGFTTPILFANVDQPLPSNALADFWQSLARNNAFTQDQVYDAQALLHAITLQISRSQTQADGISHPLSPLLNKLQAHWQEVLEQADGRLSNRAMAMWLAQTENLSALGCFVTTRQLSQIQADARAWQIFQSQCPQYYTEVVRQQVLERDIERVYPLLLLTLGDAATQAQSDSTLWQYDADSDGDKASNYQEVVQAGIAQQSLPWLDDSDGDGISDDLDLCVLDAINLCAAEPIEATVRVLGLNGNQTGFSVNEPKQGTGYSYITLTLDRALERDVSVNYQLLSLVGDSAVAGEDFEALNGVAVIKAGQRSVNIRIPVLADAQSDESQEQFHLRLSNLLGATFSAADSVNNGQYDIAITLNNDTSPVLAPQPVLANSELRVTENQVVTLDASASVDPGSLALSFQWSQSGGPAVNLAQTNNAQLSFVAPEAEQMLTLNFVLTLTNSAGLSAQASVTVYVEPQAVNGIPVVNATPRYSVPLFGQRLIPLSELLSFASDPDDDTLYISAVAKQSGNGFAFIESDKLVFHAAPRQVFDVNRVDSKAGETRAKLVQGRWLVYLEDRPTPGSPDLRLMRWDTHEPERDPVILLEASSTIISQVFGFDVDEHSPFVFISYVDGYSPQAPEAVKARIIDVPNNSVLYESESIDFNFSDGFTLPKSGRSFICDPNNSLEIGDEHWLAIDRDGIRNSDVSCEMPAGSILLESIFTAQGVLNTDLGQYVCLVNSSSVICLDDNTSSTDIDFTQLAPIWKLETSDENINEIVAAAVLSNEIIVIQVRQEGNKAYLDLLKLEPANSAMGLRQFNTTRLQSMPLEQPILPTLRVDYASNTVVLESLSQQTQSSPSLERKTARFVIPDTPLLLSSWVYRTGDSAFSLVNQTAFPCCSKERHQSSLIANDQGKQYLYRYSMKADTRAELVKINLDSGELTRLHEHDIPDLGDSQSNDGQGVNQSRFWLGLVNGVVVYGQINGDSYNLRRVSDNTIVYSAADIERFSSISGLTSPGVVVEAKSHIKFVKLGASAGSASVELWLEDGTHKVRMPLDFDITEPEQ